MDWIRKPIAVWARYPTILFSHFCLALLGEDIFELRIHTANWMSGHVWER